LDMHDPLELLVGAGVLSEIRFSLTDSHGVCSVRAILDPYAVEDYEEVDLSGLRLLANSEACATIEIVCPDIVFAAEIAGTEWVPEATDLLTCALATQSDSDTDEEMPSPTLEDEEEERDDDEYESQSWRESDGEDGDLYH
jgi:hypothetical protein